MEFLPIHQWHCTRNDCKPRKCCASYCPNAAASSVIIYLFIKHSMSVNNSGTFCSCSFNKVWILPLRDREVPEVREQQSQLYGSKDPPFRYYRPKYPQLRSNIPGHLLLHPSTIISPSFQLSFVSTEFDLSVDNRIATFRNFICLVFFIFSHWKILQLFRFFFPLNIKISSHCA